MLWEQAQSSNPFGDFWCVQRCPKVLLPPWRKRRWELAAGLGTRTARVGFRGLPQAVSAACPSDRTEPSKAGPFGRAPGFRSPAHPFSLSRMNTRGGRTNAVRGETIIPLARSFVHPQKSSQGFTWQVCQLHETSVGTAAHSAHSGLSSQPHSSSSRSNQVRRAASAKMGLRGCSPLAWPQCWMPSV